MNYQKEKDLIIELGKRAYNRGFVAANDGNISIRVSQDNFLITASGKSKGYLSYSDILLCDLQGNIIEGSGKASSEIKMHIMVYQERSDVKGIFHAHPVYATSLAVAGIALDQPILVEVIVSIGKIPLVKYATPGTDALPNNIKEYVSNHEAFLLEKHGVLTLGADLETAYYRMETVEHFSKIFFNLQMLGPYQKMDDEEVKKLYKARKNFGVREDIGIY